MRLQLNFELCEEVRHVGKLILQGKRENYTAKDKVITTVTFMLVSYDSEGLSKYLGAPLHGFGPGSLLYGIFVGEGATIVDDVSQPDRHFLTFTREVTGGVLRHPERYLRATATRLMLELQSIEDDDLSMQEMDDQLDWANRHLPHRCVMPDFRRPRHE